MTTAAPEIDLTEIVPMTAERDDHRPGGLVIGLDVDDVIYPWFEAAEDICESKGLRKGKKATTWAMHDAYGCSFEDWVKAIEEAAVWGDLYTRQPIPGAIEAVNELAALGHSIHIITARGFHSHGDLIRRRTVDWLYDHDVPHDGLTFTRDKSAVFADIYLDDGQHNVERLHALGRNVYLMDAPHNQSFAFDKRVHSMAEFVSVVEGL